MDGFYIDIFYQSNNDQDNGNLSVELTKEQSYIVRDALNELISMCSENKCNAANALNIVKELADSIDNAISFNYEY